MKKTSKLVPIIGRSSCGKSAVVDELRGRGYNVLPEVPRAVLDLRKSFGFSKEEIGVKQSLMYDLQLGLEKCCEDLVFIERGLPCIFAYSEYYLGRLPRKFDRDLCFGRYSSVFSLEGLPFVQDGVRVEGSEVEADKIQDSIMRVYEDCEYDVVDVPIFSSDKVESVGMRVDFILGKVLGKD